jgi:hypothetical protein
MARAVGSQKYGGRKKGTPNKTTKELSEFFESIGFCIPEKIHKILKKLEPEKQVEVLLKLMEYIYPKRKALEVHQEIDMKPPNTNALDLKKLNMEELQFLKKLNEKYID